MVITNFASGELSKTLFGRIDLPQYHCGAAHLENFDVIPTGGIKRRSGLERLFKMPGDCRLIPFVINHDDKFIIALFSGNKTSIKIFKIDNKNITEIPVESYSDVEFVKTLDDINDVKYAQNCEKIVLCHENYRPVLITYKDNVMLLSVVGINYWIKIYENGKENPLYEGEEDKTYSDKKYLVSENNYPRSVCFFNDRLLFAGTLSNPQRIFASRVGDYSDFSTCKKYIAEKKEYALIEGRIDNNERDIINVDPGELSKLNPNKKYYIDHRFFKEGTELLQISGTRLWVSTKLLEIGFSQDNINACKAWRDNIYNIDSWSGEYFISEDKYFGLFRGGRYLLKFGKGKRICKVLLQLYGAEKFVESGTTPNQYEDIKEFEISDAEIKRCINEKAYLKTYLMSAFKLNELNTNSLLGLAFVESMYDIFINQFFEYIKDHNNNALDVLCYRPLANNPEMVYYGKPHDIVNKIDYLSSGSFIFPLYSIEKESVVDYITTPDDGFTFEIASGTNDAIKWLAVNRGIIIGTEMAEWIIPGDIHANNTQAVAVSRYGSDSIQGEPVGAATCFFAAGRKSLIEYYPNEFDHFRANNMTLLAQQMLHESRVKEFDYTTSPYTKLFVTREDGQVVTLLYERATGTFAWARITTGETIKDVITQEEIDKATILHNKKVKASYEEFGECHPGEFVTPQKLIRDITDKIESCAVIPGKDGNDDIYMLVKRSGDYYLERLNEDGSVYLDSWQQWKFNSDDEKIILVALYRAHAVVYDEKENKVYKLDNPDELPPASDDENPRYIGYPYTSFMRSMPVIKNEKMQKVSMTRIFVRLLDSYVPFIWNTGNSNIDGPIDGVLEIVNMLDGSKTDLKFEIIHDKPNRCNILSVYAEV